MIKSKANAKAERQNNFPKLMAGKPSLIVLFLSHGCGTVIGSDNALEFGRYNAFWDMQEFTDFEGSITLSNGE